MYTAAVLCFAFLLDFIFGDPKNFPHPVVLIGKMIAKGEKILCSRFSKTRGGEFTGGMLLSVLVVCISFFLPFCLCNFLYTLHPALRLIAEVFFCYQILAAKSLQTESMKVYHALQKGDIMEARRFLSYIVGRDTEKLDETSIIKGAVETVAENTCDAVIAPMLYIVLGGAPLGFLYKAVNTLDSMIGYKNDKYLYFGKFAARLDDVLNFIPARLSATLLIFSAFVSGYDGKNALKIFLRDRYKHKSPNSGQSEAACAGALNIELGGDSFYFGELVHKNTLGDPVKAPAPENIKDANRLTTAASLTFLIVITIVFILYKGSFL